MLALLIPLVISQPHPSPRFDCEERACSAVSTHSSEDYTVVPACGVSADDFEVHHTDRRGSSEWQMVDDAAAEAFDFTVWLSGSTVAASSVGLGLVLPADTLVLALERDPANGGAYGRTFLGEMMVNGERRRFRLSHLAWLGERLEVGDTLPARSVFAGQGGSGHGSDEYWPVHIHIMAAPEVAERFMAAQLMTACESQGG